MSEATPFGIYLHIPYCKAKCRYCDFYSAPGARGVPQSYVDALLRELAKNTRRPDTLYFGGGTPALLVPAQAAALIEAANPLPGAEITLEANPDVVTPETLRGFRAAGVTRISFGVQSADDAQLRRRRAFLKFAATSCWRCRSTQTLNSTARWPCCGTAAARIFRPIY